MSRASLRRYHYGRVALDKHRTARSVFPYPLTTWDIQLGELKERQQGDLAHYWRRQYEMRKRKALPFTAKPDDLT